MHEVRVRGTNEDLPTLVMVHGYMAGGMQFCKMMTYLRDYFHVITIDLLGMGSSGRPQDFQFNDFDDTVSYFIDAIYRWSQVSGVG